MRGLSEATATVIFFLLMPLWQGFLLPLVLVKVFKEADAEVELVLTVSSSLLILASDFPVFFKTNA